MMKAKECRRILLSGKKCHALAVKGTPYCYFHQAQRSFEQENRSRIKSILVPPLEDRASIQIAITSVLNAIGSSKMDPLRARTYLYGLQLAKQNLGPDGQLAVRDSVTDPVCPDDGEFLAPEEPDENQAPAEIVSEATQPTTKGTGFSPYIEHPENSGALAPAGFVSETTQPAVSNTGAHDPHEHSAVGALDASPALQRGEPVHKQDYSPVGTTQDNNTFDISASANEPCGLVRYGAHPWDRDDPELTEEEIRKRKYLAGMVAHLLRGLHAAQPFRSTTERRNLREQLRSEYFNHYLASNPESPLCVVTSRYLAVFLS